MLAACAAVDEPLPQVAREGGAVAREYHRLWGWAVDLAGTAGPDSLEQRAVAVLLLHCSLIHSAVRFAFPRCRTARTEQQRRAVDALGPIGSELRSVCAELDMWITVRGRGD